jgi:hypothetical protein
MDKRDSRDRLLVWGSGILLATGLTVTAAITQPDTTTWLDPFFSTLFLPVLAIGALASIALRRVLTGPADKQTMRPQGWMTAWGYVRLVLAVSFICLMLVVLAALVIAPSRVTAFAEALIALVAAYVSLRLLVAIAANTILLKQPRE